MRAKKVLFTLREQDWNQFPDFHSPPPTFYTQNSLRNFHHDYISKVFWLKSFKQRDGKKIVGNLCTGHHKYENHFVSLTIFSDMYPLVGRYCEQLLAIYTYFSQCSYIISDFFCVCACLITCTEMCWSEHGPSALMSY